MQITGNKDGKVGFDYPAWNTVYSKPYDWDGNTIMNQSRRCADLRHQKFDLSDAYPHIFSSIHDYYAATDMYHGFSSDPDSADCLWSLPILSYSDGPNFEGMAKAKDTAEQIAYTFDVPEPGHRSFMPADTPKYIPETPRTKWKDAQGNNEQLWEVVRDSDYCPIFELDWENILFRLLYPELKLVFGWGENEHDDQIIADIYGAQQLVKPSSDAGMALSKIKDAACSKQKEDSYAEISQTLADLLVNAAVFWATGGGSFLEQLVITVSSHEMELCDNES